MDATIIDLSFSENDVDNTQKSICEPNGVIEISTDDEQTQKQTSKNTTSTATTAPIKIANNLPQEITLKQDEKSTPNIDSLSKDTNEIASNQVLVTDKNMDKCEGLFAVLEKKGIPFNLSDSADSHKEEGEQRGRKRKRKARPNDSEATVKLTKADLENKEEDVDDCARDLLKVLCEEPFEENRNSEVSSPVASCSREYSDEHDSDALKKLKHELSEPLPTVLLAFLSLCRSIYKEKPNYTARFRPKIKRIRSTANNASQFMTTAKFTKELDALFEEVKCDSKTCGMNMVKLYKLLLSNANPESSTVEDRTEVRRQIRLDHHYERLGKLQARIKEYEDAEVDFDDEENSAFLKLSRYKEKAVETMREIAKLQNHSMYSDMAYFSRLDFAGSKYNEFNQALNKQYRNREEHSFPTFFDVNKRLRKTAKKHNLQINEVDLKSEIEVCFREFGRLLKRRRQKDLEMIHNDYLQGHGDPAKCSPSLEIQLRTNKESGTKKLNEIIQKYVRLQEGGEEPELSNDSDDSHRADPDEDSDKSDSSW